MVLAVYSVGATVYVPHLFSSYATRYGVIGAVFAMISALFCVMAVLVGSAAAGREIDDELGRIRRGERPAEDEVQHQWDQVTAEARSRWQTLRRSRQGLRPGLGGIRIAWITPGATATPLPFERAGPAGIRSRSSSAMCTAAEVRGAASVSPTIPNRAPAPIVTTSTTSGIEAQRRAHHERLDHLLESTVRK